MSKNILRHVAQIKTVLLYLLHAAHISENMFSEHVLSCDSCVTKTTQVTFFPLINAVSMTNGVHFYLKFDHFEIKITKQNFILRLITYVYTFALILIWHYIMYFAQLM